MAFNHYAKLARIIYEQPSGWFIKRIDEPTQAQTFAGDTRYYDHYYRIYGSDGKPIKYAKFQQLERLSQALKIPIEQLPVITD